MTNPVDIGASFGQYRIEARIGQGGMGIVYRALDTKLNRPVAVKFLSDNVANADARWRFQREAQMASGLNHPHIVTVHDIGEVDGHQYVVTELIDGGTLNDWAAGGPRSWRQIVELLMGVAEGLAAAHDARILHRDIKPGNILVSRGGYAKLTDFGVAKLDESAASDETQTQTSVIIGTPAYMSPEQAAGGKCDVRSDIFSFGVVLYEMLSRRRPFEAKSAAEVFQKVVQQQPAALPDSTPVALRHLVEKALEKEPGDRYQSVREMVVDLRRIARRTESGTVTESSNDVPAVTLRRTGWIPAIAILATAAVVLVFALRPGNSHPDTGMQHLQIAPPRGGRYVVGFNAIFGGMAVSPNGETLAAVVSVDGDTSLWVQSLKEGTARKVAKSNGSQRPFWSPDSKAIGFFAPGGLYKVDSGGGEPLLIAEANASFPLSGSWTDDDQILFSSDGIIRIVPATSGPAKTLTTGEHAFFPQALPGGNFIYWTGGNVKSIYAASIAHPENATRLFNASGHGVYASGYLLWVDGTSLLAQAFDPSTLKLSGQPQKILEPIAFGTFNEPSLTVSPTGRLIYDAETNKDGQLAWYTREGHRSGPIGNSGTYQGFRLFDNGRRIVIQANDLKDRGLMLIDEKGRSIKLTNDPPVNPTPSPDGKSISYGIPDNGLYRIDATGQNRTALHITNEKLFQFPTDWSGDLLLFSMPNKPNSAIWSLRLTPDGNPMAGAKPEVYLQSASFLGSARFAPEQNQRWLAYESNETGRTEIYIQSFPNIGKSVRVSTEGGHFPVWGHDGKELYYLRFDGEVMVVTVTYTQNSVSVSTPGELFPIPLSPILVASPFDTLDGQHFLVLAPVTPADHPLHVINNWTALIKH